MGQGHLLFCAECGENHLSAMGHVRPGEPCRLCGGELQLDRRSDDLAAPAPDDRRERASVHTST